MYGDCTYVNPTMFYTTQKVIEFFVGLNLVGTKYEKKMIPLKFICDSLFTIVKGIFNIAHNKFIFCCLST